MFLHLVVAQMFCFHSHCFQELPSSIGGVKDSSMISKIHQNQYFSTNPKLFLKILTHCSSCRSKSFMTHHQKRPFEENISKIHQKQYFSTNPKLIFKVLTHCNNCRSKSFMTHHQKRPFEENMCQLWLFRDKMKSFK
jgi:ribosomal protein S27AE